MMRQPTLSLSLTLSRNRERERGFTLVEMIMVIVITGIIGGMVAVFLKAPIQQYMDVARRAEMTDIADTALRRIGRDLRLALPNSVRIDPSGRFIEFLPTTGGGRYRVDMGGTNNILDFTAADTSFEVLGPMPAANVGDFIVVYNMTSNPLDANPNAYVGGNRTAYGSTAGAVMNITSKLFPFDSPSHRFQVITTPVSYVCAPVANGVGGTLTRYWGYAIQPVQPTTVATLNGLANVKSARIATNVGICNFSYSAFAVAQRSGLVTMKLGITENNETVTMYSVTHVSNVP